MRGDGVTGERCTHTGTVLRLVPAKQLPIRLRIRRGAHGAPLDDGIASPPEVPHPRPHSLVATWGRAHRRYWGGGREPEVAPCVVPMVAWGENDPPRSA